MTDGQPSPTDIDVPASGVTRIVILGGGFAGVWVAMRLRKRLRRRKNLEVVLVSRDNFLVMTPLLFEVCSGVLDVRHCSVPIREFLHGVRFIEAVVTGIDVEGRMAISSAPEGSQLRLRYDHVVVALGARTNEHLIPGSEAAFTFKTLADALVLRDHFIERFERADVARDPAKKRAQLTFVVIGGGFVGVELFGELSAFADAILRYYPNVRREECRFFLLEGAPRLLPDFDPSLADYAVRVLGRRVGVTIRTAAPVKSIEPDRVHLADETIEAATIVLAAGISPSPVAASMPLDRSKHGHLRVDGAMRCADHPEIWALGDCALVPGPTGKPYPALAQHALREAKQLADNILAAIDGKPTSPLDYKSLGMMASLGHHKGFGQVMGLKLHGFFAWWVRRTYYLMLMPGWSRRVRIVIDWTMALLFGSDIVKVDLDRELVQLERSRAAGEAVQKAVATEGTEGTEREFFAKRNDAEKK